MSSSEVLRYIINGIICTLIHFGVLTFNIKILHFESTGWANLIAAIFGITASFIGSKYYVFPSHNDSIYKQIIKFGLLYAVIALCHGLILFIWTDHFSLDYRFGFILATFLQVLLSFIGNKYMVFNK
jgi:putative flippase GtrA